MTYERYEKAKDLMEIINEAHNTRNIFLNLKQADNSHLSLCGAILKDGVAIYVGDNSTVSEELRICLLKAVNNYLDELQKEFEKL